MRLLVLGGTVFLGRHLVEEALERGHEVTVFTRGRHNPELFSDAERLLGDRGGDLESLRRRHWDVAIDTSGYLPDTVRASATLLSDAVEHYTFVSTLAVYQGFMDVAGLDESAPIRPLADPSIATAGIETMGPLKAACERALEPAFTGRTLVVRAGLLAGPHDPTDRLTYWPRRIAQGGEVLAPGAPDLQVQLIDARDLAGWMLTSVESRTTGVFNATGPARPMTLEEVLGVCASQTGGNATYTWIDDDEFVYFAVPEWARELPLWVPARSSAARVDCSRAIAAGLSFRPLAETVGDTYAWDTGRPDVPLRSGMSREREAELLGAWHAHARERSAALEGVAR
jgi:2'-hydroxyisoflavone reductase